MKSNGIESSIIVLPKLTANVKNVEASIWDELGNVNFVIFSCISAANTDCGYGRLKLARR